MAPKCKIMKRPAAVKRPAAKTARRESQLKHAVAEGMVEKARRPMALFTKDFFAERKISGGKGFGKSAFTQGLKDAAEAWRNLPDEKRAEYQRKSRAEFDAQRSTCVASGVHVRGMAGPSSSASQSHVAPDVTCIKTIAGDFEWVASSSTLLGRGSYGVVYRGRVSRNQIPVAIKVYLSPGGMDSEFENKVYQELQQLQQPNPFLQCFGLAGGRDHGLLVMALELAADGDLFHYLRSKGSVAELYQEVFLQIASALYILHSRNIVHLDLKTGNVLLRWCERRVWLADFGMSAFFPIEKANYAVYCSANYRPPELWRTDATPACVLTPCVDMWSFGAVLFETRTCSTLFRSRDGKLKNEVTAYCGARLQSLSSFSRTMWAARLGKVGRDVAHTVYRLCHPMAHHRPEAPRQSNEAMIEWSSMPTAC